MITTNATFDAYHALDHKTPVYLIEFTDEASGKYGVAYSNLPVGGLASPLYFDADELFFDAAQLTFGGATANKTYLINISGASQRVTPEEGRASIGGLTFTLLDKNDEITAMLASDAYHFHRKRCTISTGYSGMSYADLVTVMVGWVTDIKLSGDGLSYVFSVTDPIKWMQRKIFRGAEDSTVTLGGNPINIMLQVLTSTGAGTNGDYDTLAAANGLGINDDYINVSGIEAVRDDWFPGPANRFSFSITKRIQAKKWLEQEIFKVLNVYPVIDATGKFNIKPMKPPLAATTTVQSFTEDNIIGIPQYDLNLGGVVNEVETSYDWNEGNTEFDTQDFYIDSTSVNNRGPGKSPLTFESKGITTALGGSDFFSKRKQKIFSRYAAPPPKITVQTWFSNWLTEAGDIVPFTHSKVPDIANGTRGLTNERMEVINRTIDWRKGKVKLELLATGFGKDPYCQISPSMTVTSGTSNTEFEVSSADAAKFSIGDEIAMHYANMVVQSANVTITNISGTTITVDTLGATPSAGWIAQYAVYDSCTTDQKLYWFASDGSDYLGAANDAAHLITA
jgi:hypothetical protein